MGDVSVEPSMEDILSTIKGIMAKEDGQTAGVATTARPRRFPRPAPRSVAGADDDSEILELSQPAPDPVPDAVADDEIMSSTVAAASRGSLDALTRAVGGTSPLPEGGNGVEAFVAELLRPMLREWLDAHLPELVEKMVAREIARITGNR